MKRNTIIFALIVLFSSCFNSEQHENHIDKNELKYSADDLKADFKVFRTSLEEIHPGIYSFISKDSIDFYFDNTYIKLNHPMTKDEFFRLLTPLITKLYDEHTSLDFSYRYDSVKKLLPIKIRWVNHEPYIFKNLFENPQVILGSKVVSINGRNVNEIYKELITNYQNGTPDQSLEYDVYSLHFDYLYASFIEQPDSFCIEAINPITKTNYVFKSSALLASDTLHCLSIPETAKYYCNKDTAYQLCLNKDCNYAVMKISGLNPNEIEANNFNFHKQLENDINKLNKNKINNLIIDLRYCFGGDPLYGAALVSYLSKKPFHIFDTLHSAINQIPTYSKYTDWSKADWETETPQLKELNNNSQAKNSWTDFRDTLFLPSKNSFNGSVYVLINSDIHSAAAITAALLKQNTNAIFIGKPISGPYNSGNAIDMITLTLPNTKINLYIPLINYSYSISDYLGKSKKGLTPDILITPSINDILNNKDVVLNKTISIIREKTTANTL